MTAKERVKQRAEEIRNRAGGEESYTTPARARVKQKAEEIRKSKTIEAEQGVSPSAPAVVTDNTALINEGKRLQGNVERAKTELYQSGGQREYEERLRAAETAYQNWWNANPNLHETVGRKATAGEEVDYQAGRFLKGLGSAVQGAIGFVDKLVGDDLAILGSLVDATTGGKTQLEKPIQQWADNALKTDILGADKFGQNVENSMAGIKPSKARDFVGGISESAGAMLPAIATSGIAGAAGLGAGTTQALNYLTFGSGAAGNAAKQALAEGADMSEAVEYGMMSGMLEVLSESMFAGIAGMNPSGVLDDVMKKLTQNGTIQFLGNTLGEGVEEAVVEFLTPYIQRAIYDPDAANTTFAELAKSFASGAAMSFLMTGANAVASGDPASVLRGTRGTAEQEVLQDEYGRVEEQQVSDVFRSGALMPDTAENRPVEAGDVPTEEVSAETANEQQGTDIEAARAKLSENVMNSAKKVLGEEGYKAFEEVARDVDNPADYFGELTKAYNAGLTNKRGDSDVLSATQYSAMFEAGRTDAVVSTEKQAQLVDRMQEVAYYAGRQDAKSNSPIAEQTEQEYTVGKNMNRPEVISNGQAAEVHLRDGGERNGSTYSGRQISGLEEGAGRAQNWQATGRSADRRATSLTYGEKVSTASLGIAGGSKNKTIRLVTGGETEATGEARATAKAHGLRIVFFAGDNLTIRTPAGEASVRGYISGDRVFIRVDHDKYTADQIMRHEAGHYLIVRGEINPDDVRDRLEREHGKEKVEEFARSYAEAYAGTDMTADEIWEEVICDSLGDMNIFSKRENAAEMAGMLTKTKKAAAETEATGERGPPAGAKFSREVDAGKQVEWAVKNGVISEQERAAFFHTVANINKLGHKVRRSSAGGYIVDLGNKLLFTDGDWHSPSLSSVVVFNDTSETSMRVAKDVIFNGKHNETGYQQSRQIIENTYWPGYVERYTERNSTTYARENAGGERADSGSDYEGTRDHVSEDTYSPDYAHWRNTVKGKFSMETPVEQTETLVALHNMHEAKLRSTLKLGAWPSPSIAIVQAEQGHANYGAYSAVFPRSTIDPEADSRNKVYGSDAWTPTTSNARVEYEVDTDTKWRIEDMIAELSGKYAGGVFQNYSVLGAAGIDNTTGYDLDTIARKLASKPAVQAAYLAQRGDTLEPVLKDKKFDKMGNEALQRYIDGIGAQELASAMVELETTNELSAATFEAVRDFLLNEWVESNEWRLKSKPELRERRIENQRNRIDRYRAEEFVRNAWDYYEDGGRTKGDVDTEATTAAMMEQIVPGGSWDEVEAVVRDWIRSELDGLIAREGIYNGTDIFDRLGNRKSFDQTHWPVTVENIVRAMNNADSRGANMFGYGSASGLVATATPEYQSVKEIHADEKRLRTIPEEEYRQLMNDLDAELSNVVEDLMRTTEAHASSKFEELEIIGYVIGQAATGSRTSASIRRTFTQEGYDITTEQAKSIKRVLDRIAKVPTGYFEAKPRRVVEFSEAVAVLAPNDAPADLISDMESKGINVITYEAGNDQNRLELLNSLEGVKFSRELPAETEVPKQPDVLSDIQASVRSAVREELDAMGAKYGWIEQGEKPAREVKMPKRTSAKDKVSQTVRTIMEAGATPDSLLPELERMVATREFSYTVYSDKAAKVVADEFINKHTPQGALSVWTEKVKQGEVSKTNTAIGWELYNNAIANGETATALNILSLLVEHQRNGAQAVQATRMLKQLGPEAELYAVAHTVDNLQKDVDKKYGGNAGASESVKAVDEAKDNAAKEIEQEYSGAKKARKKKDFKNADNQPIDESYVEQLGKALAKSIKPKSESRKTYFEEVTARLRRFAAEKLERKPNEKPLTATELLKDYVENQAEYLEAWEIAQKELRDEGISGVDGFINSGIGVDANFNPQNAIFVRALVESAAATNETKAMIDKQAALGFTNMAETIARQLISETDATGEMARTIRDAAYGYVQSVIAESQKDSTKLVNNAIKAAMKDIGTTVSKIVMSGNRESTSQAIVSKLIAKYGLGAAEATNVVEVVNEHFAALCKEYSQNKLENLLKTHPTRGVKTTEQRIIEFARLGAFDMDSRYNSEAAAKIFKSAYELQIDPALAEQLLNETDEKKRNEILRNIYRDIGRQMPATFADKWNAWRYLAMLGNVRTHVRNVFGNLFFAPVVTAKNIVSAGAESLFIKDDSKRTKSVLTAKDKALKAAAANDYANVADIVSGGGKYGEVVSVNQYVQEGRQIFGKSEQARTAAGKIVSSTLGKAVEKARRGNSNLLEAEDLLFVKRHYASAMASYCKAHGISAEQISKGTHLDEARAYAIKEAQKATYRDINNFSAAVSRIGRVRTNGDLGAVGKAGRTIIEGMLPFRKTPANILVRGVEYSPAGLIKALGYDLPRLALANKGKLKNVETVKTPAEIIDLAAAGLTGTMLLALGALLARFEILRGHGGLDDKEREYEEMMGHQAYSLELPDGTSVTLDWLAPEVLPLFVGVNLYEMVVKDNQDLDISTLWEAMLTITEPMLEMSCLQSLNEAIESAGYAASRGHNGLLSAIIGTTTSYITQIFPTMFGQIERITEAERMSTYTNKNSFVPGDLQYTLGSVSRKLPGDFQQIPYIDAWGRTEKTGGVAARAINNLVNPAYMSKVDQSTMEIELLRLYDETGESVLPSRASRYFTVKGERKDLSADEYVEYATVKGQTAYQALVGMVGTKAYGILDDKGKVKAVEYVYSYANAVAKSKVSYYKLSASEQQAQKAVRECGVSIGEYFAMKALMSLTPALEDRKTGDTISNSKDLQVMKVLYDAGIVRKLSDEKRKKLFDYLGIGKTVQGYNKALVEQKLNEMRKRGK